MGQMYSDRFFQFAVDHRSDPDLSVHQYHVFKWHLFFFQRCFFYFCYGLNKIHAEKTTCTIRSRSMRTIRLK
jgi:hypothetical protein